MIKDKIEIASKIKLLNALKTILEDSVILLVFVSCIYKQNIYSILLFIVLTIFTIRRSGFSVNLIRYTVVIVFVVEYMAAVACLSSYNSPDTLPESLLVNNVYPNDEYFYFYVPIYFGY